MKYFNNKMTLDEVKSTYRQLAMKLHPDHNGSDEEMARLNEEFEIAFSFASLKSESKESARTYTKTFYSQNGWDGSRYDIHLTTKEIAKLVREYIKYAHPTYRFSVTCSYFAGGSDLSVSMTEHPVELTNYDRMKAYVEEHYTYDDWCYIKSAGTEIYFGELTESQLDEFINHKIEIAVSDNLNEYCLDKETWLNPAIHAVIMDVNNFVNSYRHCDCDGMTDYFDVNFWYNIGIGKWNKPAKLVERTARIAKPKSKSTAKKEAKKEVVEAPKTEEIKAVEIKPAEKPTVEAVVNEEALGSNVDAYESNLSLLDAIVYSNWTSNMLRIWKNKDTGDEGIIVGVNAKKHIVICCNKEYDVEVFFNTFE